MQHIKDHDTGYLFDLWAYLVSKRRKLLDRNRAGLFRNLLDELPVTFAQYSLSKNIYIKLVN